MHSGSLYNRKEIKLVYCRHEKENKVKQLWRLGATVREVRDNHLILREGGWHFLTKKFLIIEMLKIFLCPLLNRK